MQTIVTLTMNPMLDLSSTIDHVVSEQKLQFDSVLYLPGGGRYDPRYQTMQF